MKRTKSKPDHVVQSEKMARNKRAEQKLRQAKVAPEIVTDYQEIQQVPVDKQKMLQEHGRTVLKPYHYQPGESGNPSGRPKDELRAIGLRIAQLKAGKTLKPREQKYLDDMGLSAADITTIEFIMAQLATSRNPAKIEMFLERVYGKVPNVNLNAEISASIVTRFKNKFTDAELERISSGEDALEILLDKLPDVEDAEQFNVIEAKLDG